MLLSYSDLMLQILYLFFFIRCNFIKNNMLKNTILYGAVFVEKTKTI